MRYLYGRDALAPDNLSSQFEHLLKVAAGPLPVKAYGSHADHASQELNTYWSWS